jgi:hypothetical protein
VVSVTSLRVKLQARYRKAIGDFGEWWGDPRLADSGMLS